jgi:hypothetical protein
MARIKGDGPDLFPPNVESVNDGGTYRTSCAYYHVQTRHGSPRLPGRWKYLGFQEEGFTVEIARVTDEQIQIPSSQPLILGEEEFHSHWKLKRLS